MKRLISLLITSGCCIIINAQIPQGFNYQAIARDASGSSIPNTLLPVRITIQSDSLGGTIFWQELHSSVTSNTYGLITLVVGKGSRITGSAAVFSDINWSLTPKFIQTEIDYNGWKSMGSSKLWSVPYSMVAEELSGSVKKLTVSGETFNMEEALFEVKNKDGQIVFAVYNEGVRIYVEDGDTKGIKGGFAVGGFGSDKAGSQKYLYIDADSIRAYVDTSMVKGIKGGFAVGGFGDGKGTTPLFLAMTPKNYFIGEGSGSKNTTGLYNSIVGYESGLNNTAGGYNAFFGYRSGFGNTSGNSNLFLGYQSGFSNTTGSFNSFVGYKSGYANTTGTMNSFLGSYSGTGNISGSQNTFIGYYAGYLNSIGDFNNFIGFNAGRNNTEGSNNVFLGTDAGYSNTMGKYNIYLGYRSGYNSSAPAGNTFIGYKAGEATTNGSYNVFIGNMAGNANTASNNAFIGNESGMNNTSGSWNAFMGYQAGSLNTTGNSNVFMGNQAGEKNQVTSNNVFIGYLAGQKHISGNNNIYVGSYAGAGGSLTDNSGTENVFLGYNSGRNNTSGRYNTFIGIRAGEGNTTGESNVFISVLSGHKNTSGYGNVLVGDQAGINNTTGYQNVIIGREAGITNSTGNRNIMIGYQAGNAETGSNRLHVGEGSLIYGEMDNDLVRINGDFEVQNASTFKVYKSGNIGVGRVPAYKFDVTGNRIRLSDGTGDWIAMRTDGASDDYLDLSFGGGDLVIQGSVSNEDIIINPSMNKVGIRTWTPQYDLDVNGNIRATGSVYYGGTTAAANGTAYTKPDYVFEGDYQHLSIGEVKEFLQKESHLPWITSALKEKEENGEVVDMTRMAFETLEAAENLQLQIIEMDKQFHLLSELIRNQQKEIDYLKNIVISLTATSKEQNDN